MHFWSPSTLTNGIPMVTGVTCQASGALGGYRTGVYLPPATFGQNVLTRIQQDARRARLLNISTSGAANFSTGTYAYDGAGNIIGMGSDAFTYDTRSRLTQGYLAGVGNPNCQSFSHDFYGNLLTRGAGTWSSGNCSVSTTTTFCTGTRGEE